MTRAAGGPTHHPLPLFLCVRPLQEKKSVYTCPPEFKLELRKNMSMARWQKMFVEYTTRKYSNIGFAFEGEPN